MTEERVDSVLLERAVEAGVFAVDAGKLRERFADRAAVVAGELEAARGRIPCPGCAEPCGQCS